MCHNLALQTNRYLSLTHLSFFLLHTKCVFFAHCMFQNKRDVPLFSRRHRTFGRRWSHALSIWLSSLGSPSARKANEGRRNDRDDFEEPTNDDEFKVILKGCCKVGWKHFYSAIERTLNTPKVTNHGCLFWRPHDDARSPSVWREKRGSLKRHRQLRRAKI